MHPYRVKPACNVSPLLVLPICEYCSRISPHPCPAQLILACVLLISLWMDYPFTLIYPSLYSMLHAAMTGPIHTACMLMVGNDRFVNKRVLLIPMRYKLTLALFMPPLAATFSKIPLCSMVFPLPHDLCF